MSLSAVYASNVPLRATLKTLAFLVSSFAAIFSASAGYGLRTMLLPAISSGADIGIAEFSTHSGLTIVFFMLAGLGVYYRRSASGSHTRANLRRAASRRPPMAWTLPRPAPGDLACSTAREGVNRQVGTS
jgi:hypothetical protein